MAAAAQTVDIEVYYWQMASFWLKLFSASLSFLMFIVIVYTIWQIFNLAKPKEGVVSLISLSAGQNKRVLKAWKKIEERASSGQEAEIKLAIIEADKILDEILKVSGYIGETMADRLGNLTAANLSNIERVWQAHKIRNRLVHETDYNIGQTEVLEIIKIYQKAFQEFGLLAK